MTEREENNYRPNEVPSDLPVKGQNLEQELDENLPADDPDARDPRIAQTTESARKPKTKTPDESQIPEQEALRGLELADDESHAQDEEYS